MPSLFNSYLSGTVGKDKKPILCFCIGLFQVFVRSYQGDVAVTVKQDNNKLHTIYTKTSGYNLLYVFSFFFKEAILLSWAHLKEKDKKWNYCFVFFNKQQKNYKNELV